MKELLNGAYVEMDEAEVSEINRTKIAAEKAERTRPLTAEEVTAMLIKQQINTLGVDDNTALRMRRYYPTFAELVGQTVTQGTKFRASDSEDADLYKTIQPELTIQAHYLPSEGMESMYTKVNETHEGTMDDPIPYDGNMALESDKYYHQNYVNYL